MMPHIGRIPQKKPPPSAGKRAFQKISAPDLDTFSKPLIARGTFKSRRKVYIFLDRNDSGSRKARCGRD